MFVTWKRNVLFETAVLFAERWRHLTYSNEPNFINNALRALLCSYGCASLLAVREAPSNGLRKYHRREGTEDEHSHVDFLTLIIYIYRIIVLIIINIILGQIILSYMANTSRTHACTHAYTQTRRWAGGPARGPTRPPPSPSIL